MCKIIYILNYKNFELSEKEGEVNIFQVLGEV